MAAPPWMPLYVADYLADTGHLSTLAHGAYILLIMHYWQTGGLPTDDLSLAQICRSRPQEWTRLLRPQIAPLFSDQWKHKRIEKELSEAIEFIEKRSEAGKAGASARWGKRNAIAVATVSDRQVPSPSPSPSPIKEESPLPPKGGTAPNGARSETKKTHARKNTPLNQEQQKHFEEFYGVFPRKEDRGHAQLAYAKALTKIDHATIFAGAREYRRMRRGEPAKFTKLPATWLNGECWADQSEQRQSPAEQGAPTMAELHEKARERFAQFTIAQWRGMAERSLLNGWPEYLGDPCGPDCLVPDEVLKEFPDEQKKRAWANR